MEKEFILIAGAVPSTLLGLLIWFANRMVKSADKKLESDELKFIDISKKQQEIFLMASLIQKDVAVLTEKFKDVEQVKKDINAIGGKLRNFDIK